ncbi:MAG: hypothetical protein MUF23_10075 [Pirellula sp.]|jgi:hypothetical protein|nr:hypothetical protein [Pirellula sp.]
MIFAHTFRVVLAFLVLSGMLARFSVAESTSDALSTLRSIQPGDDKAQQAAAAASKQLSQAKDLKLMEVLKAMKGASPIGKNWLMGLANQLYRKSDAASKPELTAFLGDTSQDPEARYTVYRWVTDNDPETRGKFLDSMLEDPSLEIRFDAVAHAILKSEGASADQLKRILDAARHPTQIVEMIEKLKAVGVTVDQSQHMGFVTSWKLIGPFDNVGSDKFDVVYDVETDWLKGAVKERYSGKNGETQWLEHTTDSKEGQVDVAKLFNNEKGCIVYAATIVKVPSAIDCEVRVGCINAQKVWVNGELVIANEVYHTGAQIDQYAAPIKLKAGENRILVKVCQNEQKEAWAQDYSFQLRLCDATGKAITWNP